MTLQAPPPFRHTNLLAVVASEIVEEWTGQVAYPPGETSLSLARLKRFNEDARGLLLENYERFGPVFTVRMLQRRLIFMVGPEANHYMTVSNASNFTMRESLMREIAELGGDGLFSVDGEYHRRMRRTVLPALQADSVASYSNIIVEEAESAFARLPRGEAVDMHSWARELVLRIIMRSLFGFDPDSERVRASRVIEMFNELHRMSAILMVMPGRFSPKGRYKQLVGKLEQMIYSEIAERRARGGGGSDIMSLLMNMQDEEGDLLSDQQIRDQAITLLLASGATTGSVLSFFLYELARHPGVVERILAEQRKHTEGGRPSVTQLKNGELVELEMALDEALRMYPSVWIGPRRARSSFEFAGVTVPENAYVNYCPLVSHYLPEIFPEPERYRPERFAPEAKTALPKGAYVPFGGGSRTCIGMRLALMELRTITSLAVKRFELEVPRDFSLKIGLMPMMKPKGDLSMIVRDRAPGHNRVPALAA